MILRIYAVLFLGMIIGSIIFVILDHEVTRRNDELSEKYLYAIANILDIMCKVKIAWVAVMFVYSIILVIYCIIQNHHFFIIIPISFFAIVIFGILSKYVEYLNFLTEGIAIIACIVWLFASIGMLLLGTVLPLGEERITENVELVQTIDILEFKQVPYSDITGSRYYIKSTPNSAYYYEVATGNDGTTTKVIDGSANYVEKHESDEYIDNPHIDVYRVSTISQYETWFGKEVTEEKNVHYNYYIYTPENSMFYEE